MRSRCMASFPSWSASLAAPSWRSLRSGDRPSRSPTSSRLPSTATPATGRSRLRCGSARSRWCPQANSRPPQNTPSTLARQARPRGQESAVGCDQPGSNVRADLAALRDTQQPDASETTDGSVRETVSAGLQRWAHRRALDAPDSAARRRRRQSTGRRAERRWLIDNGRCQRRGSRSAPQSAQPAANGVTRSPHWGQ